MSILGEDVVATAKAKARASANQKRLDGVLKQWYMLCFVEDYVESSLEFHVNLLHYLMKHFCKTYEEAAVHIACTSAEVELYRLLVQAYVSDQELYQTLLRKTVTTLLRETVTTLWRWEAEDEEVTEDN